MAEVHESKYKKEDNWGEYRNCGDDHPYSGTRRAPRPKHYCDQVTIAKTLGVSGATTLSSTLKVGGTTTISGNASVSGTLTCGTICASVINWGCQSNSAGGVAQFPAPAAFTGGGVTIGGSARASGGGSLTVHGPINGTNLVASGAVTCASVSARGDVSGRNASLTENITCSSLTARGGASVSGNLSCGTFTLGGQSVRVKQISVVTGVNFKNESVSKSTIQYLGVG